MPNQEHIIAANRQLVERLVEKMPPELGMAQALIFDNTMGEAVFKFQGTTTLADKTDDWTFSWTAGDNGAPKPVEHSRPYADAIARITNELGSNPAPKLGNKVAHLSAVEDHLPEKIDGKFPPNSTVNHKLTLVIDLADPKTAASLKNLIDRYDGEALEHHATRWRGEDRQTDIMKEIFKKGQELGGASMATKQKALETLAEAMDVEASIHMKGTARGNTTLASFIRS